MSGPPRLRLCAREKTGVSNLINEVAYVCFIFDISIRNLPAENALGTEDDLTLKVRFVLTGLSLQHVR